MVRTPASAPSGGPPTRRSEGPGSSGTAAAASTRERILDIALDLFVEQGYDKTSLREIAEPMGFTKAALYYHFASKSEILLALHLRLHAFGNEALRRLGDVPATPAAWSTFMQEMVDDILAQRQLLVLHERNRAAIEAIGGDHQHDSDHDDMEAALRRALSDPTLSHRDRVRLGSSIGAAFSGMVLAADVLADIPIDELGELLREVIRDVFSPPR